MRTMRARRDGDAYAFDTTTPSTDFGVAGLKNSDTVNSVTLSSAGAAATATFVAPGPTYAITVRGASGTGLGNYIISYTPGTLTITQADIGGNGQQREQDIWQHVYV